MAAHHLQEVALRYFLEVSRRGSLTEASERLHVAASAISRQIAGLEEALGTPLFERRPRGMILNAAGEILAAHALRTELDAERTVESILALEGLYSGKVRIAASEGFANEFLPSVVSEFRRQYEGVVFELNVELPAAVSAAVRNGDVDIGLRFSRGPEREIKVEHRAPVPLMAVMRPDHPLAAAKSVTLRLMSKHKVALPKADMTVRQLLDMACSRQQLSIEPVLTSNSMTTLCRFVLEGDGITVASEVSLRDYLRSGVLAAVPIRDHGIDFRDIEVQTMLGRVLPHAAQRFLDLLKRQLMRDL